MALLRAAWSFSKVKHSAHSFELAALINVELEHMYRNFSVGSELFMEILANE